MLVLTLLILPFVGALLTALAGNRSANKIALLSTISTLLYTLKLYFDFSSNAAQMDWSFNAQWLVEPNILFGLSIDGLSLLMLILTNLLTPIIVLSGLGSTTQNSRTFYSLILAMQGAMNGVFLANEGFTFYVFWELSLIPIYFIALLWGRDYTQKITFKFFVYTLAGSLLMLISMIVLYLMAGSLQLKHLHHLSINGIGQTIVFLGFFLAFAIKVPVVPFHTWQADTYTAAPTQGTMLLSGLMLKMGLYGFIRWLIPIVPLAIVQFAPTIITLGIIGVVYGAWIAIQQDDIKRLFAYSSLSHVGLITAGIFTVNTMGLTGASIQMLAHGINVVGLFFAAEVIFRRTGTYDLSALGGIRSKAPWFSTYFFILLLGSIGLPLTNAFVGEFMLIFSVWQYNSALGVFAGLTIILAAVYMLRMFQRAMLGNANTVTTDFQDLDLSEHLTFIPLIILVFVLGVYPMPIIEMVEPVIQQIIQLAAI
ncbi:MAG: NADH-quinone oxidoreductase subunit M [Chitinophagales bacterium]|nr:NADH-quinone oxidoreductase subunit M [Chitinophagales bacterium]